MIRLLSISSLCLLTLLFATCQQEKKEEGPVFSSTPSIAVVQPTINEVSGIADSKRNPGYLWAHEDGGNPPELHLVGHNGTVLKTIYIKGIINRDWEDMAVSGNDLYIGDIGDNSGIHAECMLYKISEPSVSVDTVRSVETIRFQYPDGPRDAEAFFVDPGSAAIYIISKRDNPSRIYKLTPPFSSSVHTAQFVGQLTYGGVVSAAISPDGKEIITKTYAELGYYKLAQGESVESALSKAPKIIPYVPEPQGEAVCFSAGNSGYYTMSEKASAPDVRLYFYKRN